MQRDELDQQLINTDFGLAYLGFRNPKAVHWNLSVPALYEASIRRDEGQLAAGGPLVVRTGVHTGRSASDKFIVRDSHTESAVWWENNNSMSEAHFYTLYSDMLA